MWALAFMAAGTALQAYGAYRANQDQANAEAQNAAYYREQAEFIDRATSREKLIAERNYRNLISEQAGAFASSGVDVGSGSALQVMTDTRVRMLDELGAIANEGEFKKRLAMLRADSSDRQAEDLRTSSRMQVVATALTGAGQVMDKMDVGASRSSRAPKVRFGGSY